jgi:hypothetical protein
VYVLLIVVCPFVLFLLAIVLSVLLRDTDSDYSFGIFKLFLYQARKFNCHVYVLGVSFVPIFLQFFNWILELLQQCGIHENPYLEEEQTTQWPKEKVQKDKQRSTKHTHKTKDRVT